MTLNSQRHLAMLAANRFKMAASIMIRGSIRVPSASASMVIRTQAMSTGHPSSDSDHDTGDQAVKQLKDARLSALKKGTGGRSSFSGIVATVFGASGFVGNYVCNQLGKRGTQIVVPYRGDHYAVRKVKLCGDLGQVLFTHFHLKDEATLHKAMKYSNVVINLIGKDNVTSNFSFHDVHVKGARDIARIARECGVQRLIHVSALNCAEKPKGTILKNGSQFLSTKWEGEQVVREEFPEATIFRPSDIYGQEDRFLRYYAGFWRRNFTRMPLWDNGVGVIKQPVYVSDVVKGITASVFESETKGKTFQAVGPKKYELTELMDWFYRVMRRTGDWGYKRTNLKYDLLFWLRIAIVVRMIRISPFITWDRIERETVSDFVDSELPTLEDLGVVLTEMESRVRWELEPYRAYKYYDDELGEFEDPAPPQVYTG